jgi:hypothetical protein
LKGKKFILSSHSKDKNKDLVFFFNDQGRLTSIPCSWTSIRPVNVFAAISKGRTPFCPDDLLKLSDVIEEIKSYKEEQKEQ